MTSRSNTKIVIKIECFKETIDQALKAMNRNELNINKAREIITNEFHEVVGAITFAYTLDLICFDEKEEYLKKVKSIRVAALRAVTIKRSQNEKARTSCVNKKSH